MQLLGRSKCLSAYQFAARPWTEDCNHLKYGRQSLMSTEIGAVGSGFRHVGDNVIDLKTRANIPARHRHEIEGNGCSKSGSRRIDPSTNG